MVCNYGEEFAGQFNGEHGGRHAVQHRARDARGQGLRLPCRRVERELRLATPFDVRPSRLAAAQQAHASARRAFDLPLHLHCHPNRHLALPHHAWSCAAPSVPFEPYAACRPSQLGVVIFEMLTLRLPFEFDNLGMMMHVVCNGKQNEAALAACGHADALRRLVSSENLLNVEPAERMTLEQLSTEATLLMWDGSSRRSSEAFSHHAGCGSGHGSAHSQV